MGIPNLIAFLRKKAPTAFRRAAAEDFHEKRVGVDLSITLYRGAAGAYKHGPLAYLETLLREVRWLRACGCQPVYVVDGEAPAEKAEEAQRRSDVRTALAQRLHEAQLRLEAAPGDPEASALVQKLEKQCVLVTPEMRDHSKAVLDALGVPFVVAPAEAERCLAHLLRARRLDVVVTEDVDVLVCGAPAYVKNAARLAYQMEEGGVDAPGKPYAEVIELQSVLAGLELSYGGFVTMAVLAGCDFAPKLPRMGPATAWKLVKKVSEDVSECLDALKVTDVPVRDRFLRAHALLRHDEAAQWPEASEARLPCTEALEALCTRLEAEGSTAGVRAYLRDLVGGAESPAKRSRRA